MILAVLFVGACGGGSSTTSPPGPVAMVEDLRRHLDAAVLPKAPADAKATRNELATDVHGVAAKLVWYTFADGPNKYLLSVHWEVVTAKDGVMLEPLASLNPTNAGTAAAIVETVPTRVRWRDGRSMGELSFRIDASGTAAPI